MMDLHAQIYGGLLEGMEGGLQSSVEEGLQEAKKVFIEQGVKDKFATYSAGKYGFFNRSPRYQKQKRERETMKDRTLQIQRPVVKPPQALVLFGDLKKELMGRPVEGFASDLVATARQTELRVKVRAPHPMLRRQWLELKKTTPAIERRMTQAVRERAERRVVALMRGR
jgi:hypothetical protein